MGDGSVRGVLGTGAKYGTAGVSQAENGSGIFGRADGAYGRGVYGWAHAITGTASGGYFLSQSTSGRGVYGYASATSGTTYGGYFANASSSGYGVYGDGESADVVLGGGDAGTIRSYPSGIHSDMYLYSNDEVEVHLDDNSDSTSSFSIFNGVKDRIFGVDESGNMSASGTKSTMVTSGAHTIRKMYAIESPEVWFEDFGAGQLTDGESTVYFDPVFAQTVNLNASYHVFVTPVSDKAVLLFVTTKGPSSFTIRGVTLAGEPVSAAFDYRIVARRVGYENLRLEPVQTSGHSEERQETSPARLDQIDPAPALDSHTGLSTTLPTDMP
jgi:hypothetical protein